MRQLLPALGLLVAGCAADVFAFSDFRYDADSWGLEGLTAGTPTLSKSFGNPAASICANDDGAVLWRFVAPTRFTGDASKFYGRLLSWDATTTDTRSPMVADAGAARPVPTDAVWIGSRGITIAARPDFDAEAGITWTSMSVTLDVTSHWHIDGAAETPATQEDIQRVLKDVTSIAIRGGWSGNSEEGCIDNVYFGVVH
jgi:hypothetical protein